MIIIKLFLYTALSFILVALLFLLALTVAYLVLNFFDNHIDK